MSEKIRYNLWFRKADETLQVFPLSGEVLIGNASVCTIKIDDKHAASQHARLRIEGDQIFVTDLNSEHGTLLDGNRLDPAQPTRFVPGQILSIGDYTFSLFEEGKFPSGAVAGANTPSKNATPSTHEDSSASAKSGLISFLVRNYYWFVSNVRWLGPIIWIGVVIIAIAAYFIVTNRMKTVAVIETSTPVVTREPTREPTVTPEFISPTMPAALPVSTLVSVIPPGEGEILIEPITLIAENINLSDLFTSGMSIGQLLELTTNIAGEKIGYAYRYVAVKYDQHIITIQKSFISAETTREIDGVPYPDWGSGNIPVEFEWKPGVYYLSDGNKSEVALVYPTEYGVADERTQYAVDGLYIFTESGDERRARAFFDHHGKMLYILGYKSDQQGIESPYDIRPQTGDQFTILLEEFRFEEGTLEQGAQTVPDITNLPFGETISGLIGDKIPYYYGKGTFVQFEGGTLTFGDQGLFWTIDENYSGEFYVGFAAEDLDGNEYAGYVPVLVKLQ